MADQENEDCLHCQIMDLIVHHAEDERPNVLLALVECCADICTTAPENEKREAMLYVYTAFARFAYEIENRIYKPGPMEKAAAILDDGGDDGKNTAH